MTPTFAVLNVCRLAFDEEDGIKFGPSTLNEAGAYSVNFFSDVEKAEKFAEHLARIGAAGALFELKEVRIVKPTPIEVITISRS